MINVDLVSRSQLATLFEALEKTVVSRRDLGDFAEAIEQALPLMLKNTPLAPVDTITRAQLVNLMAALENVVLKRTDLADFGEALEKAMPELIRRNSPPRKVEPMQDMEAVFERDETRLTTAVFLMEDGVSRVEIVPHYGADRLIERASIAIA